MTKQDDEATALREYGMRVAMAVRTRAFRQWGSPSTFDDTIEDLHDLAAIVASVDVPVRGESVGEVKCRTCGIEKDRLSQFCSAPGHPFTAEEHAAADAAGYLRGEVDTLERCAGLAEANYFSAGIEIAAKIRALMDRAAGTRPASIAAAQSKEPTP